MYTGDKRCTLGVVCVRCFSGMMCNLPPAAEACSYWSVVCCAGTELKCATASLIFVIINYIFLERKHMCGLFSYQRAL